MGAWKEIGFGLAQKENVKGGKEEVEAHEGGRVEEEDERWACSGKLRYSEYMEKCNE